VDRDPRAPAWQLERRAQRIERVLEGGMQAVAVILTTYAAVLLHRRTGDGIVGAPEAGRIRSGSSSHIRALPSMSVNR